LAHQGDHEGENRGKDGDADFKAEQADLLLGIFGVYLHNKIIKVTS
jgi:hypothetical protein